MARSSVGDKSADRWDKKLRDRGHVTLWLLKPGSRYAILCTACGQRMECGPGPATGNLRRGRCGR